MRLVEKIRNRIETSPNAALLFSTLGRLPFYQAFVAHRTQERIAYVEQQRCYSLMIELSSICNARCVFCPYPEMKREKRLMGDELFNIVLRRLQEEQIRPPLIDLFDIGEPLLDRDLCNRVRKLKAIFPSSATRITTNFSVANEARIEEILDCGLDSIHISLNASSPATYEKLMGLHYDKTKKNLERLLRRRDAIRSPLKVMLSMVLYKDNAREAPEFVKTWEKNVDSICIQRAIDWGGLVDVGQPYPPGMRVYPCNDLFERIVILSNGEIALCCQDHEGMIGLNVREKPILDIFRSRVFRSFRDKHLGGEPGSMRICANCFAIHSNGANWMFKKFD